MKEPGLTTVKTLFALSGNVCAFRDEEGPLPACEQRLTDPSWKRVMAEICHIYGERPGSARWDPAHDEDGHEHWNLILLCPTHHTVIDDTEPDRFPVEKLYRMKERAESANRPPDDGVSWSDDDTLARVGAAALETYRRLGVVDGSAQAEDPRLTPDHAVSQLRSELVYHSAWARELSAQFREEGLLPDELDQYQRHEREAARLRSLLESR